MAIFSVFATVLLCPGVLNSTVKMCYLASGVLGITDAEVGLLSRLAGDFAGDVAMSLLDCSKASVENCKTASVTEARAVELRAMQAKQF